MVEGLGTGGPITGELLVVWAIPQHELPHPPQIAGMDAEVAYLGGVAIVQKRRNERFEEI